MPIVCSYRDPSAFSCWQARLLTTEQFLYSGHKSCKKGEQRNVDIIRLILKKLGAWRLCITHTHLVFDIRDMLTVFCELELLAGAYFVGPE